jgi:hypothetical protein
MRAPVSLSEGPIRWLPGARSCPILRTQDAPGHDRDRSQILPREKSTVVAGTATCYVLSATCYVLVRPATCYGLRATGYGLRATGWVPRATCYVPRAECDLRHARRPAICTRSATWAHRTLARRTSARRTPARRTPARRTEARRASTRCTRHVGRRTVARSTCRDPRVGGRSAGGCCGPSVRGVRAAARQPYTIGCLCHMLGVNPSADATVLRGVW